MARSRLRRLYTGCSSAAALLVAAVHFVGCGEPDPDRAIRLATFNVEDVRTSDLVGEGHERLTQIAEAIQEIRPDILLINEIAYDYPELAPGDGLPPGSNATRLVKSFLSLPAREDLRPLAYTVYQPTTNTGLHSGFDLDNSGDQRGQYESPAPSDASGSPPRQTAADREYGNDCWGFGTFPGQYGMALLVRDGFRIREEGIRTYQQFLWSSMPDALVPRDRLGNAWYSPEEWGAFRLSSKTHALIPVELEDGRIVSVLISHPTPPAFDGPEGRNKNRNHDEIRLLSGIVGDEQWVVDDAGRVGGVEPGTPFVILGDLNADSDEGSSVGDPVGKYLSYSRSQERITVPVADSAGVAAFPELDPDDTARFGMRVDYVLPSEDFDIVGSGIHRSSSAAGASDHFPVWVDVILP